MNNKIQVWDIYTASALQGLLAGTFPNIEARVVVAEVAASIADIMMKEREKRFK